MTAYRFVTLTCDTCGSIWDCGDSRTVAEARKSATREGWVPDGRHGDRCGICAGTHESVCGAILRRETPVPGLTTPALADSEVSS